MKTSSVWLSCMLLTCTLLLTCNIHVINGAGEWGTVKKPFSVNSLWNSRPVNPILDTTVSVPLSSYFPTVAEGIYSTGVFVASDTDGPMYVYGPSETVGIVDADSGGKQASILIPRWPSKTVPASGSDGHCEIYDPIDNVIHSFWKLTNENGTWRGYLYGWTALDGTGWGDPAHFYTGARASGVVSSAGLIRTHEINDGDTMYRHALTMSLTYNGLSADPTYIYPATAADGNAATTNYGGVPEGALLMLPSSFNASKLTTPKLRKIAETLKTYGARVTDRNVGTPYVIYVEIGSNFTLYPNGWNNAVANDLQTIRAALHPLVNCSGWLNGDSQPVTFSQNQNLLSMRGGWSLQSGPSLGSFNTWKQALVFPVTSTRIVQVNSNRDGISKISWAKPVAGNKYIIKSITTGGGQLRFSFNLNCTDSKKVLDSGYLNNGQNFTFVWPTNFCWQTVWAASGVNQASTVSATLLLVEDPVPVPAQSTVTPAKSTVTPTTSSVIPNQSTNSTLRENSASSSKYGLLLLLCILLLIYK